ncbi:MAG: C39 family peptidase [Candidatus Berkelbacteria bacterium]|nr:C39 family peptidase [Candidatus Berkelbacteria bacterium]MCR4307988.1 C39 family peptidase [Candidatus Berkelbacteria bacterium]
MSTVLFDVPLYSQSWDLDEWKKLSFESYEDAEYWQRSCCGILCMQEIAAFFNQETYSTPELIKRGIKLGGYSDELGWRHDGLVKLAESLDLHAQTKIMSKDELRGALDNNKLPIVSIKWAFKPTKTFKEKLLFWKKYGGHLAVVVGYDEKGFYVNHTSKIAEQNWKCRLVPFGQFGASYTGRSVLVWK